MRFLSGETAPGAGRLTAEMQEASDALEYERAARLRDRLVRGAQGGRDPADGLGPPRGPRRRSGSPRTSSRRRSRCSTSAGAGWSGASGSVADKVEDLTAAQFVGRVLEELYGAPGAEVPAPGAGARRCPTTLDVHHRLARRAARRPGRSWPCPQRGDKRALHETVTRNAAEDLTRHRLRRAGDHNARAKALTELASGARRSPGAAAHRVLRHEPPAGHRLRRVDGGVRGRAGQEVRLPALHGEGRARATTTTRRWRRC